MNKEMNKVLLPILALVIALGLALPVVGQITIYDQDRPGWEAAVYTWETEDFTDATLNPGVSVVTTYPGYVDPIKGVWWDRLVCPGEPSQTTTTWQFDPPIVAFGGDWNPAVPGGLGANISVAIDGSWVTVGEIPNTYTNEFWGFTSTLPFSQIRLQNGSNCENGARRETYELDNMSYSFQPIEVEKEYTYTDVCFEKDNDGDGEFNEDPVDGIDNDGDGAIDEDPVDCPGGTSLGTPLDMECGNYIVEAVVKGGKVKSYNPGQYYAVSNVTVPYDVDELTIEEDWCDCTGISALSPANGGGSVVIVKVNESGAYQIFDAKSDNVTFDVSGCIATATLGDVSADTTILMYVKFGPAMKGEQWEGPIGPCENTNTAWVSIGEWVSDLKEAIAMLELIEKV